MKKAIFIFIVLLFMACTKKSSQYNDVKPGCSSSEPEQTKIERNIEQSEKSEL